MQCLSYANFQGEPRPTPTYNCTWPSFDLTKAYDNINWNALWQVLRTYGVVTRFINLLEDLHSGT
jgi:hypothetical protein